MKGQTMNSTARQKQGIGARGGIAVESPTPRTETSISVQTTREQEANTKSKLTDRPDLRAAIEIRAYHHRQANGGRHGNALNHWLQAEREIMNYARTNKP
jgi:hypothetical protein